MHRERTHTASNIIMQELSVRTIRLGDKQHNILKIVAVNSRRNKDLTRLEPH